MRVRILPSAERDLTDGTDFYDLHNSWVGTYFIDCLISDIDSLALYGGIHEVYLGFHRSLSKRFPFAIYYKTLEDTVCVYAVLDCRLDTALIDAVLTRLGSNG